MTQEKGHRYLSQIEKSLWLGSLVSGVPNNLSLSFLIGSQYDVDCLKRAILQLVANHPVYGSVVCKDEAGRPYWKHLDYNAVIIEEQLANDTDDTLNTAIDARSQMPFDLTKEPPCRFFLLSWNQQICLTAVFHHAVSDGESMSLFVHQLSAIYQSLTEGKTDSIRKPHVSDYVLIESALYAQPTVEDDKAYWNEYVACHTPSEVSSIFPDSLKAGHICNHPFTLDRQMVLSLSRRLSVTPFQLMAAVWGTTVMKIFGVDGVYLNYAVNLRPQQMADDLGCFVNNLLLYVGTTGNGCFLDLLRRVVSHRHEARQRQYLSVLDSDVQNILRSTTSHVGFNFPFYRSHFVLNLGGEDIPLYREPLTYLPSSIQLDIEQEMNQAVIFTDASYPAFYSRMMADTFKSVLCQVAANHDIRLSDICLLDSSAISFNKPISAIPIGEASLTDLFRKIASEYADQPACYFGTDSITYHQLDMWSDLVASMILSASVTSDFIGVYCSRSIYTLALLIGVWKAGKAYIPLDPYYSIQRLTYIISDSQPSLILTDTPDVPVDYRLLLVTPEDFENISLQGSRPVAPSSLSYAYMIYTSGTTGQPKGTPIYQRSLLNLIAARQAYIPRQDNTLELSYASISFDASVWDIFPALFTGTPVLMASDMERRDPSLLLALLESRHVSCACIPPSMLAWMPYRRLPSLRYLVVAGESCPMEIIQKWQQTATVINAYGPTESTVCTTMHRIAANDLPTNIGQPLSNVSCYILDENLHELPVGVKGELYIGGAQLTEGYYQRPDINARKFFDNPFVTTREREHGDNLTIYASGDQVYRLPNGDIIFCGRIDSQVKLNGFRIELDEIAHRMESLDDVSLAVADVIGTQMERQKLVAWVQTDTELFDVSALKHSLEATLPPYMVPSAFYVMDKFPMTTNGKIDRRALKNMAEQKRDVSTNPQQLSAEQARVAQLWHDILPKATQLNPESHFFSVGGDSLSLVALAESIEEKLGVQLTVSQLYQHLQLDSMAQLIISQGAVRHDKVSSSSLSMPSHLQGLLMDCLRWPGLSQFYQIAVLIDIPQSVDVQKVLQAWNVLLSLQDGLRLCFPIDEQGRLSVHVNPYQPMTEIPLIDVVDLKERDAHIKLLQRESFPLHDGPLYLLQLYRCGKTMYLAVIMHHLITDGWSVRLLKNQMDSLLHQKTIGSFPAYSDYLIDYARYDASHHAANLQFWDEHLSGVGSLSCIGFMTGNTDAVTRVTSFSEQTLHELTAYCADHQLTLFQILMSAYAMSLSALSRQQGFLIGYPMAGRYDVRFSHTLGYFVHPLLCPCPHLSQAATFEEWCRAIAAQLMAEQAHPVGLGEIIALVHDTDLADLQVFFTLEDDMEEIRFVRHDITPFPLILQVIRHGSEGLSCHWTYHPSAVTEDTVVRLSEVFAKVVVHRSADVSDLHHPATAPVKTVSQLGSTSPASDEYDRRLCAIVAHIIGCPESAVLPDANLFTDLGLSSVNVMELVWQASNEKFHFTVSDVYKTPDIRHLSAVDSRTLHWWHKPYRTGMPTVILVSGYTHAIPFYNNYADALSLHANVLVFESFMSLAADINDDKSLLPHYIDYMYQVVTDELLCQHIFPYAVTGHSMGAELGMQLAERLRRVVPDIRMVAISVSLATPPIHHTALSHLLPAKDYRVINAFYESRPQLNFGGTLAVALETKPSSSLIMDGADSDEARKLTAAWLPENLAEVKKQYPQARLLLQECDHFGMLDSEHLDDLMSLFFS